MSAEIALQNCVLVIDDEDIVRDSISTYLEDSGFVVHQAKDGKEGLERFRQVDPNVVLLDLRMPRMDGLEVLASIAEELDQVPVIVVTGAGVLQDAVAALRLGAFDFVTKPIVDMAVLEHAVNRALERTRLIEENRRYQAHLEDEIRARTQDLRWRTEQLLAANAELEKEMAIREKTASALKQSEARLAEVVSIFEGFIYTCDSEFCLDFVNRKLADHVGGDVAGKVCHHVLYGLDQPCPWCRYSDVFGGQTAHTEFYNEKDGRWYDAVQSPMFGSEGQVRNLQAVVLDISERKATEDWLRQREAQLSEKNRRLKSSMRTASRFGHIIGKSRPMQEVYENILKAAESNAHVIIYGESGTGKELVAKTIHDLSDRGSKKFVTVHCGAIPDNLIESEFFGYRKGAFTGADQDKPGYLDAADGGTLFMDEVGELNLTMQVKLLRAIEGGGFTPIGSSVVQQADIRIVAATNRNLRSSLESGRFRKDFYYRIHILPIYLPCLKSRKEDIPLLVNHFVSDFHHGDKLPVVPQRIIAAMQRYDWPGNVRELQNSVHRYITLGEIDFLDLPQPSDTPDIPPGRPRFQPDGPSEALSDAVSAFEKAFIEHQLKENQWHRSRVAELLGIDRRTLFRKMKAYGL
ncbi:sigma 54-interacting transcriptional regulator [uncultured Desulfosarcina sp.]|uniref:sigma 54-interacting transcriptional regulator n=1 Tax=uncultured Desulfosarcina sp. TaxID=218289 RepID=UPI0029C8A1D4|nr:sigma 54-interacting transcriptional regulator [uncultured Desulfosarcina sp.]